MWVFALQRARPAGRETASCQEGRAWRSLARLKSSKDERLRPLSLNGFGPFVSVVTSRHLFYRIQMNPDCATMRWGPVCAVIWRGITRPSAIVHVKEMCLDALQEFPSGIVVVGVVEDTAQVPDAEARALSATTNDAIAQAGAKAFAGVIPGNGFVAAWVRSVITGLNLLARKPYPFRVFENPLDFSLWASDILPDLDPLSAAGAIDQFRREYQLHWSGEFRQAG